MQIIIQRSTGRALRRVTEPDARRLIGALAAEFGEVDALPIAHTSFGDMEFNAPRPMVDVTDLDYTYCSECGRGSQERPAADLTVVREESRDSEVGSWRFFCPEHVPGGQPRAGKAARSQRTGPADALCPNCFTYAPEGTECGTCGVVLRARTI